MDELKDLSVYRSDIVKSDLVNSLVPDGNLLETIYSPYISKIWNRNPVINKCKLDKFIKKFKITSNILDPMKEIWEYNKCYLAGGKLIDFLNNKTKDESVNDYDIWFSEVSNYDASYKLLTNKLKYKTNNAKLGHLTEWTRDNIKLQLITKIFACPEDIIEQFDIRACAICTDSKYIYWIKGALHDIIKKQIVMTNPRSSTGAIYRIIKYIQKGYDIKVPDIAYVCIRFLDSLYQKTTEYNRDSLLFDRNFVMNREDIFTQEYEENFM